MLMLKKNQQKRKKEGKITKHAKICIQFWQYAWVKVFKIKSWIQDFEADFS